MLPVLNPTLYGRLKDVFGRVDVARYGEAPIFGVFRGKNCIVHGGEAYRVNCTFCEQKNRNNPDTRQRLWIGHLWGVPRQETHSENWGEAACFHNDCTNEQGRGWENLMQLKQMVYTDRLLAQGNRGEMQILDGDPVKPVPEETTYPGECLPLEQLAADHPAITYVCRRNFDPVYLSQQFGVRYCLRTTEDYPACLGRLIIPIFMGGKMRTWQARYIGEPRKGIAKYINQKGASKTSMLYGHDAAMSSPFVTITEGVTNVWRLGSGAVATLGKYVSIAQYDLLKKWQAAVIALDPDAYFQSEDVFVKLGKLMPVVKLMLPKEQDPDSLGVDAFWDLVVRTSHEQSVQLPT
jgi:hypothetical protein